jgi:predicted HicB family RNase H-like nuclease
MDTNPAKRPLGRPRKYAEEPARLDLRLTPELRRRVRMAAAAADCGLGEWVIEAIQQRLARDDATASPAEA